MPRRVTLELLADRDHYEQVTQAVLDARQSVWIATANLKEMMVEDPNVRPGRRRGRRGSFRSVLEVFSELANAGVELRLLHASPPSRPFRKAFDSEPVLVSGGLEMRTCPRVHLKTVVVDARLDVRKVSPIKRRPGAGQAARGCVGRGVHPPQPQRQFNRYGLMPGMNWRWPGK